MVPTQARVSSCTMAALFQRAMDTYNFYIARADPRVLDYPMMTTPIPSFIICSLYVFISVYAGPRYMKNRPAYSCKPAMVIYNFFMVFLSGFIFYELGMSGWWVGYSLGCQPVDYSNSPTALRMVRVAWLFFFSKYLEMIDTMFLIIRKKNSHLSFLHIFHHGVLPFWWWFGIKGVPGGMGTFHAMVNVVVHFIMYTYYGISALGPQYQKYLWWKKYLTGIQISQFIIVCIHSSQLLFIECSYPGIFVLAIAFYQFMFLCLFTNFYIKSYMKSNKGKGKQNGSIKNGNVSNGHIGEVNGHVQKSDSSNYQNGSVHHKHE